MIYSPQQLAIFEEFAEGTGNVVVEARAGTGKTTTALEALAQCGAGSETMVVAFNASIAREMKERVSARGMRVDVQTLHAYGLRQVRSAMRGSNLEVAGDRLSKIYRDIWPDATDREKRNAASKLSSRARSSLCDVHDSAALFDLAMREDLVDIEEGDEDGSAHRSTVAAIAAVVSDALTQQLTAMRNRTIREVDFDDMVWLPVAAGLKCWTYRTVVVDEAQDLSSGQLELVKRARTTRGRVIAIGDPKQAIYGFRGANSQSISHIIREMDARVLPLTVTYRCAKSIVTEANRYVPDYQAAADAKEGTVRHLGEAAMFTTAGPGDFILSRTNAPLLRLCLAFYKANRRARIEGRDVGKALAALVEKSHRHTVEDFLDWLDRWAEKQIQRKLRKDPDADVSEINDKRDCLEAVAEGANTLDELVNRLENLFGDRVSEGEITLSSVHRAKGSERHRAFLLWDTFRPHQNDEEQNLAYVAITRAKDDLIYVRGVK